MAKKSSKGKDKKLARKAENERAAALAAQLRALNDGTSAAAGDLLAAQYPAFQRYNRGGIEASLRFFAAEALPPALLDWALGLTRLHMAVLYDACPGWGWSDSKKRAELADPAARYLVVFLQPQQAADAAAAGMAGAAGAAQALSAAPPPPPALTVEAAAAAIAGDAPGGGAGSPASAEQAQHDDNTAASNGSAAQQQQQLQGGDAAAAPHQAGEAPPVAFVHFRFEEEEGEAVLYCYEIQVAQAAQGKGLGKFLMQLLELIARRSGVARLMLTVFHANTAAVGLYRRLGYVLDGDSPGAVDPAGDHKYEIMTKWLRPQAATLPAQA